MKRIGDGAQPCGESSRAERMEHAARGRARRVSLRSSLRSVAHGADGLNEVAAAIGEFAMRDGSRLIFETRSRMTERDVIAGPSISSSSSRHKIDAGHERIGAVRDALVGELAQSLRGRT